MSERRLSVDTDRLHSAGTAIEHLANEIESAVGKLNAALTKSEGCRGEDTIGKAFAGDYLPKKSELNGHIEKLSKNVRDTGAGLHKTAKNFADAERAAIDSVPSMIVDKPGV